MTGVFTISIQKHNKIDISIFTGFAMKLRKSLCYSATWISLTMGIVIGYLLGLNYSNVILCIIGWSLFILGFYIHYLSHREHPKAHLDTKDVDYVAKHGIYAWVRHPGYLGLILAFFGLALAFGSIPALIIALALTFYHYYLAIKEEKEMLKKFSDTYAEYMREVPDRFLPIRKIIRDLRRAR